MSAIIFTLLGEPASKANSRKLVTFGGKPRSIKSDKARDYERWALAQIPPLARQRLTGELAVTFHVFYASERPDLDESLILDVLQDRYSGKGKDRRLIQKGVYQNDRQVREKHVYHAIDKNNPRTIIEVRARFQEQLL
jgi:Holliday junction resolvase RusA-like endonuclease